jgi:predicted alpha-1,2-mannosidase
MKVVPVIVLLITAINICVPPAYAKGGRQGLTKYVNPLIGTAKTTTIAGLRFGGGLEHNAQVQPSVTAPFGMTNWSPQTHNSEKKCLSAYYYKDSVITGFRGSHWLSGSCTQEYGSMAVMPVSGNFVADPKIRGSFFSHSDEIAAPFYYKVYLKDYDIIAEMSATPRCGIMKFTFKKEGMAHIAVSPNTDEGEGIINVNPAENEITGSNPIRRIYQGWGKLAGFSGHFVVKIKKQQSAFGVFQEDKITENQTCVENKPNLGGYISFRVKKGETVYVKIGTSFVSIDQARKNLDAEIPGYDFDSVVRKLEKLWEERLSRITVEGKSKDDKVKFYTALYHSLQQPRIYNDVDGCYPRFDGNAATDTIKKGNYYCDFSIWDTYRALHPLYNIILPAEQADMVKSLLMMGKAGGWLPIFPKWNSYTAAMIGDHAIALIAESYVKGVIGLSEEEYQLMKKNATKSPAEFSEYADGKGRRALKSYLQYGYVPLEDSVKEAFHKNEQVSRTLEYAYDDYALALTAQKMGKTDDYNYFLKRSENYRNVFDTAFKNMNGRYAGGAFYKNLDKKDFSSFITEGSAWQYNWYVPHNVAGLAGLMGGWQNFSDSLDAFFAAGQYWHGNEPGHQIPFLYNYAGKPYKTQQAVAKIMEEEYGTGPGGLSGNDDAGQMSAWYVLGALGFYPVSPVSGDYQICGPKFNKIKLTLGNGKILNITAPAYSAKNIYIKQIKLNGKEYKSWSIPYSLLMQGGNLDFDMTEKPGR